MKLNLNARPRLEKIAGDDRALIVDDFYIDPYQVRERALQCRFHPQMRHGQVGGFYPGALAPIQAGEPDVPTVLDHVGHLMEEYFPVTVQRGGLVSDFGVITVASEELTPTTRHPHVDSFVLLALVYLNPFSDCGTSFYRNREMRIHAVRSDEQQRSINDFTADPRNSRQADGYISGSNRHWERLHAVAGTFNRFVAYPGNVLHSGDVFLPGGHRLGDHRLTQRFLLIGADVREPQESL